MIDTGRVALRWTLGDVSERGFESLRLSVRGAYRLFGPEAIYVICVNTIGLEDARYRTGELPPDVQWMDIDHSDIPAFLRHRFSENMAEGAGWRLAPLRLFDDCFEISLDNDCVLWQMPVAMRRWLEDGDPTRCLIAEDVRRMLGMFDSSCGPAPRNPGIRGLPPGFDLQRSMRAVLSEHGGVIASELDEQGLQVAAVQRVAQPWAVSIREVSICSPFRPHMPDVGRCGAHFVGINARHLSWDEGGQSAIDRIDLHWQQHRAELYRRIGLVEPITQGGLPL